MPENIGVAFSDESRGRCLSFTSSLLLEIFSCCGFYPWREQQQCSHSAARHQEESDVHKSHHHLQWHNSCHNNHGKIVVVVVLGVLGSKEVVGALESIVAIGKHCGEGKEEHDYHEQIVSYARQQLSPCSERYLEALRIGLSHIVASNDDGDCGESANQS